MAKITLNEYERLMSQAADKMRELQEQRRDLLEACKAALAQIESDDSYWDAEGPTARTLRAAIQKAEGK